jgi:hypothetical protein
LTGTPVAGFIVVHPRVQIKPVEGDTLFPDGNLDEIGPDVVVEAIAVHPDVSGGIPQPDQTG